MQCAIGEEIGGSNDIFGFLLLSFNCLMTISVPPLLVHALLCMHDEAPSLRERDGRKGEQIRESGSRRCLWNHLGVPMLWLWL